MSGIRKLCVDIKEARFMNELVNTAGRIQTAYQKIRPDVTDKSAGTLGTKLLDKIGTERGEQLLAAIGWTPSDVIRKIASRTEQAERDGDFFIGMRLICKITGLDTIQKTDMLSLKNKFLDGDIIEVVKMRMKKKKVDTVDITDTTTTEVSNLNEGNEL